MSLIYTVPGVTSTGLRNSIYIGGRSDAKSLDKLQKWRISRILNVTPAKEASIQAGVANFFEKTHSFVYKRIPIYDSPTSVADLERQVDDIVTFISNGLFHGSVLVHCERGVSRSTTCVLLYLMRKAELSLADALKLVQRRRPEAQPIPAFMQFLERYEKQCQEFNTTTRPTKRPRIGPTIGPPTSCPPTATASATTATSKGSIGPSIGPVHPTPPPLSEEPTIGPAQPQTSDVTTKTTTTSSSSIGPVRPTVPLLSEETTIGPVRPQSLDVTTTTTTTTTRTTTNVTTMPLTGERTGITRDDKNLDGSDEDNRSTVVRVKENPDIGPSPRPPPTLLTVTTESGEANGATRPSSM